MTVPVEITFRGMDVSPAAEQSIKSWANRLAVSFADIERCSVVVELPHRHHRRGKTFHVTICVSVPGRTIAITRDPGVDHAHEDVYVAIADAFRAARRALHEHARIRRGEVKPHTLRRAG
jgi:ribosome-associated translation inhibitor RaiA